MASNPREWSVPAPVRALLWWPGVSFVLVIVAPSTIEGTIPASGALLAVIGGFAAATAERLREHRAALAGGSGARTAVATLAAPAGEDAAAPSATTDVATRYGPASPPCAPPEADPPTTELPRIEITPAAVPAGQPAR